jgi:hypothetical protein
MTADAAVAVVLGAFPGATALPRAYGPPGDPVDRLMAAGRRVSLRDGALCLDGDPVSPEALAAAAAELPARGGRGLDMSNLAVRGPCPSCGQPTICGWAERAPGGGWREVRSDPTPCTECRAVHDGPVWAVRPRVVLTEDSARLEGGYAAPWWAARAGEWAAPRNAPSAVGGLAQDAAGDPTGTSGYPPAAAVVLGSYSAAPATAGPSPASVPVEVRDGALYVNGAAVAEGIDPAAVVVLGRRVCVGGRQVGTLPLVAERERPERERIAGVVRDPDGPPGFFDPGVFFVGRDGGSESGPFRGAGYDIRAGDRIAADYATGVPWGSSIHLHLFDVEVTRDGETVQRIPHIEFATHDRPIIRGRPKWQDKRQVATPQPKGN